MKQIFTILIALMTATKAFATKFPVSDYIDFSLPSGVCWAKWNMGSSSELDVLNIQYARYGWGDPTGEVRSASPSAYTAFEWNWQSQKDISGTKYDRIIITKDEDSRVVLLDNIRKMGLSIRDIYTRTSLDFIPTDYIDNEDSVDSELFKILLNKIEESSYQTTEL